MELRERLYGRLTLHGADCYLHQRTGNLMALATNDIDARLAALAGALRRPQ